VESTVPTTEFPPANPFTVHMTEVLLLPVTLAVNGCWAPATRVAEVGLMVTVTGGAVSVTVAWAFLVVSACETAKTVTDAGFGSVCGAVYTPVVLMVPIIASPPGSPFTCQVTAVLVEPVTVAVNG
jgi:hypothetical protein